MSETSHSTSKKTTVKTTSASGETSTAVLEAEVEVKSGHATGETKGCADKTAEAKSFLRHARRGAADLFVQHLHGITVGLTHFLEEREKAMADEGENYSALKHLNAAHRKYKAHTHDAGNEFVDHLLEYKKSHAR